MTNQLTNNWAALEQDWVRLESAHLRELFNDNPKRFAQFSASQDDLTIDFSKERIDSKALENLLALAEAAGLESKRDAMFAGERINNTEDRAVLHTALRGERNDGFQVNGEATANIVEPELERFLSFADQVRSGKYTNAQGQAFTDVVNIGIGGSDLGPVMAVRALSEYRDNGPKVHFVSNVDGAHLRDVTKDLDPATTLILVASKTFTTQETMANAQAARIWLATKLSEQDVGANVAALSTNLEATQQFGIANERVFGFWDWVGGRYSLSSAIGLSIALAIGAENFRAFLSGLRDMDQHFKRAPLAQNLPVLLALVGIWRRNIMACSTVALIPYDQRLERFPAYVQQMDMESNGKQVDINGDLVEQATGPIIWGEPGTNAQHSFFQLLHQGTDIVPVDFILSANAGSDLHTQHNILAANCLAQSEALAFGKTADEVRSEMQAQNQAPEKIDKLVPHRTFPGNRPSTSIIHKELSPYSLGRLIALFEHKVFVQGVIWGVNSFDQWGVELGKVLANQIAPLLDKGADLSDLNASTRGLIERINALQK